MKPNETRANFNIDRDLWFIFKTMANKYKAVNENGRERQATATDILEELIYEWITEHKHLIEELLKELRELKIEGRTRTLLEEWKKEEGEKQE